jgi:hypothetical protein
MRRSCCTRSSISSVFPTTVSMSVFLLNFSDSKSSSLKFPSVSPFLSHLFPSLSNLSPFLSHLSPSLSHFSLQFTLLSSLFPSASPFLSHLSSTFPSASPSPSSLSFPYPLLSHSSLSLSQVAHKVIVMRRLRPSNLDIHLTVVCVVDFIHVQHWLTDGGNYDLQKLYITVFPTYQSIQALLLPTYFSFLARFSHPYFTISTKLARVRFDRHFSFTDHK